MPPDIIAPQDLHIRLLIAFPHPRSKLRAFRVSDSLQCFYANKPLKKTSPWETAGNRGRLAVSTATLTRKRGGKAGLQAGRYLGRQVLAQISAGTDALVATVNLALSTAATNVQRFSKAMLEA